MSNNLDRSENHLVSIRGLEGYEISNPQSEFHLMADNESSSDEYSLKEEEAESSYLSLKKSFSISKFTLESTFYTWYAWKKTSYKTSVFFLTCIVESFS